MARRGAVFLDRDGTLVDDPGFLRRPEDVVLFPGAAAAVRRLNQAGWPVIVVTNQSGIARGLLTEAEYRAVERRVDELLAREGAHLTATYHCPHYPSISGPCECRKPGLLLYQQAAEAWEVALDHSWWVGDRPSDVLPALAVGGKAILVGTGHGDRDRGAAAAPGALFAADLGQAVELLLAEESYSA
jgi:histidinol-phosphate phosphatase family protein